MSCIFTTVSVSCCSPAVVDLKWDQSVFCFWAVCSAFYHSQRTSVCACCGELRMGASSASADEKAHSRATSVFACCGPAPKMLLQENLAASKCVFADLWLSEVPLLRRAGSDFSNIDRLDWNLRRRG